MSKKSTERIKPTDGSLEEKTIEKKAKGAKKAKDSNFEAFELTPDILAELEKLFIAGVPARDDKFPVFVNFRTRQIQIDILSGIRELCPVDWFKTKSDLSRSVFAIGCRVVLEILNKKKSPKINELIKIMKDLNLISRTLRKAELEKEVSDLQNRVLKNGKDRDLFKLRQLKKRAEELI